MRLAMTLAIFLPTLLAPSVRAGDLSTPDGLNVETKTTGGSVVARLDDGSLLRSTGSFLAEVLKLQQTDGTVTVFADGFGSLAGVVQQADGTIVVGDSAGSEVLWLLDDINDDGDAMDPGETTPHPAAASLFVGLGHTPFDLTVRADEPGVVYSVGTDGGGTAEVARIEGGTATLYADGMTIAGGLTWDADELYVIDFGFPTRVMTFQDGNDDDDALDPGEQTVFADGLVGGFDIVQLPDGSFVISGYSDFATISSLARLLPDDNDDGMSDGLEELWIDGVGFTGTLVLDEGPAGFVPGASGDGVLYVADFDVFGGSRDVRTAPFARLDIDADTDGVLFDNSAFNLTITGAPGASTIFVLSLDTTGITIPGIGDVILGFSGIHVLSGVLPLGRDGRFETRLRLDDVGASQTLPLPLNVQAFTLEGGDVGISNGLQLVIEP